MSVRIRRMTDEEFEIFYHWSVEHHAKELMEEAHLSWEEAIQETMKEVSEMLPDGLNTENNDLMTIEAEGESAGFIWTVLEETDGRKQSFVCDFAIWASKRRKGYGAVALCLAEKNAGEAGCRESVLFVADKNDAARALYEKCGYQVLRQAGYGRYMTKQLVRPYANPNLSNR